MAQTYKNSEVREDFSDRRWGPLAAPLAPPAGAHSTGSRGGQRAQAQTLGALELHGHFVARGV
eukprot:4997023-Pyramimonas_sp.AAC.1